MLHRRLLLVLLLLVSATLVAADPSAPPATQPSAPATRPADAEAKPVPPALNFTMRDIDGKDVPLATYRGRVVLIVNVASKCGFTKQYQDLQALYEKHSPQGLVILGFPANNFGGQEPGAEAEIKQFCTANYGVTFPMFAKISAKGDDIAPLYRFLTSKDTDPQFAGPIAWNFEKFLLNRHGEVVARWPSKVNPQSVEMTERIAAELAKPK